MAPDRATVGLIAAGLADEKAAAVSGDHFDVWRLAPTARQLLRLQDLGAESVVREYLAARDAQPEHTKRLEHIGWTSELACREAVRMVVNKLAREAAHGAA